MTCEIRKIVLASARTCVSLRVSASLQMNASVTYTFFEDTCVMSAFTGVVKLHFQPMTMHYGAAQWCGG